jgi:NitT/TauT family transport system substrate-binding protein
MAGTSPGVTAWLQRCPKPQARINPPCIGAEFVGGLEKNPKLAEDFVRISQKAFAACVADVAPCLKALLDQASGLDKENRERQWERIKFLMRGEFTTSKALGWIDAGRMSKDYELVQTCLGMEKPFAVESAFTTRLLDPSIKMDVGKVKKVIRTGARELR